MWLGLVHRAKLSLTVRPNKIWLPALMTAQAASYHRPSLDDMDPEDLVAQKRRARAAKKAIKQLAQAIDQNPVPSQSPPTPQHYLPRQWKTVNNRTPLDSSTTENPNTGQALKIMTWNILAQCLVRRTLFPGSDCLKWKDRGPAITEEIVGYDPDVICLQEVDRLSDHGPVLTQAGFDYTHVIGGYEEEGKQHGLLIGWKRGLLHLSREQVIRLDEQQFQSRRGLSRVTRNVALLCSLAFNHRPGGLTIGTAHLFWHARFAYERTRQTAFLARALCEFNTSTADWPVFLAGDLNEQPGGPAYRCLSGVEMPEHQRLILKESSLVHCSVDKSANRDKEQYVTLEGDEDRVFKDVRSARAEDGLFELEELRDIYGPRHWLSLYGNWGHKMVAEENNWFKSRPQQEDKLGEIRSTDLGVNDVDVKSGHYEPMWTNFTPLWRCTLDYIWVLDEGPNLADKLEVVALLPTHRTEVLGSGLPRLGIEPSDHIALMAELIIK